MPQINYLLFSATGAMQGGHKMIVRHVETLRDLGFDAVVYVGRDSRMPTWFEHRAPVLMGQPLKGGEIMVAPDDGRGSIARCTGLGLKTVVFAQNPYYFGTTAFSEVAQLPPDRLPPFLAVAPGLSTMIRRLFPEAQVELTPAFADERIFKPGADRRQAVAFAPRKRVIEAQAIRSFFGKLHPAHAGRDWTEIKGLSERQAAQAFAEADLSLSLSRMESLGMTTLEAMASGCVCAGFTGIGGDEYATPENGFWARDDDCMAAADALGAAADLVAAGGAPLRRMQEAGYETAARWSHAAFREALEAAWMKLAPEARLRAGPLD